MYKNIEAGCGSTQKRLEKASQHVNDLWFPVNSELLAKLKMGLHAGVYDLDPEALVSSISNDFSLFMYCIRELIKMLKAEDITVPLANPIEALRQAGVERLRRILDVDESRVSRHTFDKREEFQELRLQEVFITTSTAQALSTSFDINQEIGYSAAILRQLGHTLIAWNYPTVYQDAMQNLTEDTTIDQRIAERLGFSPALLSVHVLMQWGVPIQLCEAIFLEEDEEDREIDELQGEVQKLIGGGLSKICKVGEALARANNPDVYPSAAKDWEYAKEEITQHLGENGLSYIQEVLEENLENYLTLMPEVFNGGLVLDPELHLLEHDRETKGKRNPYIMICPEMLADSLRGLYKDLKEGEINEKALHRLIQEIIPGTGFTGGYIYTADPGVSLLIPQTTIGSPQLKQKTMIDYSIVLSNSDPVTLAFRASEPVIEYGSGPDRELLAALSGVVGFSNRIGVLYLELPYNLYTRNEKGFAVALKAISKSISDCLDLN